MGKNWGFIKRDVVVKSKNKYFEKVTDIKQLPLLDPDEFLERVVTTGKIMHI